MTILRNCKLTYFPIAGRGEAPRLALSVGKIPFTDNRIAFAEWKELKASTPWGSLPVLTLEDGTEIAQQRAILRLVGKEAQLYPDDVVAAAKVDSLIDATEDLGVKTNAAGQGLPQAEKEAARKAAVCEPDGAVYGILSKIDSFISKNGSGGHAVGSTMTIADLFVYTSASSFASGLFDGVPLDALDKFPAIMAVRKTVRSDPAVSAYYDGLDESIKKNLPASFGPIN